MGDIVIGVWSVEPIHLRSLPGHLWIGRGGRFGGGVVVECADQLDQLIAALQAARAGMTASPPITLPREEPDR